MYRAFAVFVFLILFATRWPLAPKYLYFFDSVNFALALDDFDPANHQPQPPGYPLFVGLMKVVHLAVAGAEHVLIASGLLVGTGAILLLWKMATEMYGRNAGFLAAALLIFNPPFWFGGITNQVRLCLALCSAGIALLAWRALQRSPSLPWLAAAFACLGVSAGFRPDIGAFLFPLLLWVWWRTGATLRRLAICLFATVAAAIPWVAVTSLAVGGFEPWVMLMWQYVNEQFHGTSLAFGAPPASAWNMAKQAIVWNGLGTIAWIWAIPFVRLQTSDAAWQQRGAFLAVWFCPAFLFSAFIHIGDPDQALATVPVLCVIGGAVIASALERSGSRKLFPAAAALAFVNAVLFFFPPGRLAKASGYSAVASIDRRTRSLFASIGDLRNGSSPLAIVHLNGIVSWRQLTWYFPDDYVVFLPPGGVGSPWTVHHRKAVRAADSASVLPGPARIVAVAPFLDPASLRGQGWIEHGPAWYRDVQPGTELRVGGYTLRQPAGYIQ